MIPVIEPIAGQREGDSANNLQKLVHLLSSFTSRRRYHVLRLIGGSHWSHGFVASYDLCASLAKGRPRLLVEGAAWRNSPEPAVCVEPPAIVALLRPASSYLNAMRHRLTPFRII